MSANKALTPDLVKLSELDRRLVEAARPIKVLAYLDWPTELRDQFLASWRAGQPTLPHHGYAQLDMRANLEALREVSFQVDVQHPVGRYIHLTAGSYITAAAMLMGVGSPAFTACSQELYGRPDDPIGTGNLTNIDAADHFIRATDEFRSDGQFLPPPADVPPEQVVARVREVIASSMPGAKISVEIDPKLPSKAAAGGRRIRIQSSPFTRVDVEQIVQHEVLVHSATMRSGKEQPHLRSMGLGAPRTTRTQEGLATLAELVTSTMDLGRLRRIALRIRAIKMALDGADFLQVFRYFLDSGQDELESYQSSMRIFRGGDVRGRVAFTKDGVYVQGLLFAHVFLRKAVQSGKHSFVTDLFAGRLTLGDVVALEPYFESGFIQRPKVLPPWVANDYCLAASLSYSIFASRINLGDFQLDDFLAHDM